MGELNEYQKRALLSTFAHMDGLLTKASGYVGPEKAQSPFSRIVPDATPAQRQAIAEHAARVRARMLTILDRFGIPLPERHVSAIQAVDAANHDGGCGLG